MFESLKRLATQKLMERMASNTLSGEATSAAAEQGAGALIESIKSKLGAGGLSEVTELFSGNVSDENSLFANAKAKMTEVLKSNGMNAEEAAAEAEDTTPELIAGLKDKFQSTDEADKEFDLSSLTSMIPGNAGDMLNKAKNLFG